MDNVQFTIVHGKLGLGLGSNYCIFYLKFKIVTFILFILKILIVRAEVRVRVRVRFRFRYYFFKN